MATVASLITRVEKRLAMAAGIDVQIHAEETMLEMLRHKYNTLFDDRWWLSYLTLETFTLDGVTGLINGSVENKIRRFIDIQGVFLGGNQRPLPILAPNTNPILFMGEAVGPYAADPTKLFKIYPIDRAEDVHIWYRTRIADEDWVIEQAEDVEVNMDDELLILGTVYDYLTDDGSNEKAVEKYEAQYNKRYQQLVAAEFQLGVAKADQARGIPTQWRIS